MRIYKTKILIGLGLVIAMAGCKKAETFPVDHVSSYYVFNPLDSAGTNAQAYLYSIYNELLSGHNRVSGNYLDAASDDAISSSSTSQVTILATGAYSSVNLPSGEDFWTVTSNSGLNGFVTATSSYWSAIGYANEFINNIGVVPVKGSLPNGVGERWVWQSEARFLRAYFYFELVKRYGGVPLLGNNTYTASSNLQLSRSTFAQCITYIVNECNAIKDSVITIQSGQADNYRVTQGAVLALKARVLLYAASPLFNDPSASNTNPYIGYTNYDPTRWNLAAQAAQDVINLNAYGLYPSFRNLFTTQYASGNNEIIFIRPVGTGTSIEADNAPVGISSAIGGGITSPTQDLVNAFPMINGKAITDPTSGYNAAKPYTDRDPRFAATILYNGTNWLTAPLATYNGGASRPLNGQTETLTGYYMGKFMYYPEDTTQTTFASHVEDWVFFRYGEILLNYAEAENEAAGPSPAVYSALYQIRARAGIPAGTDGTYGLGTTSDKTALRLQIQNERRIEMAFEEQRYFDIRRWKIAETVMNQPRMGVSINNSGGTLTYNYVPVLTTKFVAPTMYLYPIPYSQVIEDPNLKQNPGW